MEAGESYLRPAMFADCDLLFQWANDSDVRINSFHSEPIEYHTHVQWFQSKLNSTDCDMYLYVCKQTAVGQIRLDYRNGKGQISYSIAKEYRGQGYGKKMLFMIEKEVEKKVQYLTAFVKKENQASQLVFERLGYVRADQEDIIFYQKKLAVK